jgi:tripartite-type tricarboxylate transporter receptor subunit TctC
MRGMLARLLHLTMAAALGLAMSAAPASAYPDRPIRFIVPFPPGGSTDHVARAMQPQLEKILGQSVVIENRPGAGGVIGVDAVAKSPPDGYTIGMGAAGALSINVSLNEKMPFDPLKDLAPVSKVAESPFMLAAAPSFKVSSLRELIAQAKSAPGNLAIGHGGNGTTMHLTAMLFNGMAGLNLPLIPYRGTAPVVTDLIGGHIVLGIVDPPPAMSAIQSGRIKPLAVSSKRRFAPFAEVPTFDEQGLKGFETTGWFGIVVPAATAPDIVAKLNAAVIATLTDAEVAQRIRAAGMEPTPMSTQSFAAYIRSEIAKYATVASDPRVRQ